ncbi:DNA primase family protein [Novosphingobium mangrovi (ex Huang et al. 2023)]|uniref:Phage/plasmid primase, P4 family n=1 Tax=Novosphingobium mangrovi (ex Huang et al. 2023) TaxID=2976432 RepID=A0ABT2I142_9SPHN|nr:phage/plasmid primase, P4 family [Novosphingobium mangrovi (ex Huang et al. 2023)]MCT2398514.1 phage/plasmid primase, P4 family [Novosphingobium mangrovi (ex Huang et al. 2023)]
MSSDGGMLIPVPVDDPLRLAMFECNDYGNGRRVEALAGGKLKWVDDKFWAAYDDRRWSEREGAHRARQIAHQVAQHLHEEAFALGELIGDPKNPNRQALTERFGEWFTPELAIEKLTQLHKHAIRSGNANFTTNMLIQARDLPGMRADLEDFDRDPLTYNVLNGTIRFRKDDAGVWRLKFQHGHEPGDMLMQLANVEFDPAAKCPMWEKRLELVQPDPEQRAMFPRMYGQTLTGLTDSEEFYVHKGRGGDGKSKTHEVLAEIHGDYYRHAAVKTWLQASFQKSGAEHRRDLVDLSGDVRFIVSEEPPPRVTWDGELLKQWTGGGKITAFQAGEKKPVVFKPRGNLFVEVNPTPKMPGDDKGFRRRFRLVLWLVDLATIPGGFEPPAELHARLMTEASGILNWMIAGCLEWLGDRRVPMPEREAEALVSFWAQGNPLGEWLGEECDLSDRDATTGSTVLWEAFKTWMERSELEEEQRKKWNTTRFGRELNDRQIIGTKDRRGLKIRRGIRLRAADPLLANEQGPSAGRPNTASAEPTRDFQDGQRRDDGLGDWQGQPFGDGDPLGGD